LTTTPGPPKPAPPLPKPTESTVSGLLLEDAYYSSFYNSYRFPNTVVYETIAQECLSGISVLYRSCYDIEGISYGWTIYSSSSNAILDTGVVSRGFVPHVSSMQRKGTGSGPECIIPTYMYPSILLSDSQQN